jgi:nitroreductase
MNVLEAIQNRRSIRKYQDRQIPKEALEKIMEAGTCAPNAGGGQRTIICGVHNKELTARLGILNLAHFDRSRLAGGFVSKEQPSNIDDPTIKNGFYGAPSVCVVFAPDNFLYSIPDAFCCAENMTLAAFELGISSCIVARSEETFDNPFGKKLMEDWDIPEHYIPRCFVLLGYVDGDDPAAKPRKAGRIRVIEDWR